MHAAKSYTFVRAREDAQFVESEDTAASSCISTLGTRLDVSSWEHNEQLLPPDSLKAVYVCLGSPAGVSGHAFLIVALGGRIGTIIVTAEKCARVPTTPTVVRSVLANPSSGDAEPILTIIG